MEDEKNKKEIKYHKEIKMGFSSVSQDSDATGVRETCGHVTQKITFRERNIVGKTLQCKNA